MDIIKCKWEETGYKIAKMITFTNMKVLVTGCHRNIWSKTVTCPAKF